jgi:SAM-dependent methyltransferase
MNTLSSEVAGILPAPANRKASPSQVLVEVAQDYPSVVRESQLTDVERIAFHIGLIQRYGKAGGRICDMGGGVGMFAPACAVLGYDTTLIDDFRDELAFNCGSNLFAPHARHGVKVISRDVMTEPVRFLEDEFPEGSFDVVTVFDSMEHWRHSVRPLFRSLKKSLAADGIFIICSPKRKNLPRRVLNLLRGRRRSTVREWYDSDLLHDEVREPGVSDLRYICRDLGLKILSITGRNWLDRMSYPALSRFSDPLLRVWPEMCSDMYLVGAKIH